jgi:pimeloyl-ACP methyl ester carboxylesterase
LGRKSTASARLDKFILLGHSHGAYIALNYALRHPSHLAGLILISPQLGMREVASDLRRTLPRRARDPKYSEAATKWNAGRVARTDMALGNWLRNVFDLYFFDPQIGRNWWPRLHFDEISAAAWLNVTASNAY